jgi:hypothetical protein
VIGETAMFAKFSVKKPFTVLVVVILILVLGYVSVGKMTPDLLPDMSFPYIVLFTTYPGASPEEVETAVTKPLEQAMSSLDHIKSVTSKSSENLSVVYLKSPFFQSFFFAICLDVKPSDKFFFVNYLIVFHFLPHQKVVLFRLIEPSFGLLKRTQLRPGSKRLRRAAERAIPLPFLLTTRFL